MPSVQENHELVTSGPYHFVRHPIYTGMLVALFGSALVGGTLWLLYFVAVCAMFVWRVGVEEKFMTETFPQKYPEYKKRTKALIPFMW
jgi:protein-S-isoprenylcysteine O-methyltransferase Ste14